MRRCTSFLSTVNDSLKYRVLKDLAETLDVRKTLQLFPGMTAHDMKALFLSLAETFQTAETVNIYVDGASRGNPGDAGIGIYMETEKGAVLKKVGKYIGRTTNNSAEYRALLEALKEAKDLGVSSVRVFADSELMVRQIKGEYKVKSEGLKPLYQEAMSALMGFKRYDIIHIERERNKEADRLANKGIDQHLAHSGRE